MPVLEISVYSLESALNAARAGAGRLELCAGFPEGGTTPSPGLMQAIRRETNIPLHVMIRPRGGDFLLTKAETAYLADDIAHFHDLGADGFVCGALDPDGNLDEATCAALLAAAQGRPCVFHRAFDLCRDPLATFETLHRLGFAGLLSSGQARTAPEGAELLAELVRLAPPGFDVIPACGINPSNLTELHAAVRAPAYHASATAMTDSPMRFRRAEALMNKDIVGQEYRRQTTDPATVRALRTLLDQSS